VYRGGVGVSADATETPAAVDRRGHVASGRPLDARSR